MRAVKTQKGFRHYREFIEDWRVPACTEGFVRDSGYIDRVAPWGDLQR